MPRRGLVLVGVHHGLRSGFLDGFQLFLFRFGLGVLEHDRRKVELLVAVDVVLLFQQAHGVVLQVDERTFFHLAALGRQAGPLLDDGVDRGTLHSLGVVGVAVLVVQLEDAQHGAPSRVKSTTARSAPGMVVWACM